MQHLSSTFASGRYIYYMYKYAKRSVLFFLHNTVLQLVFVHNSSMVQQCRRGAANGFNFENSILQKGEDQIL
ncbi:hypothetical protein VIGAN_08060000 [Vigna angularis var. angularis]|uniref:Uncharacterized protein n=1 Tax=Vigna angularis var. angularis TaxID=157739 RepID=A0A0S3SMH6_PHAAN|nr:hypothetical protein VIGAN_08060000 [Vigna angularis var. angularis]